MKLHLGIPLAISLLSICTSLFGQKQFYILGGSDFAGLNYDYKFQQHGNILKRGWYDQKYNVSFLDMSINAAIQWRVCDFVGIEAGARITEMDLGVYDKSFQNRNKIDGGTTPNFLNGGVATNGNFEFARFYYCDYASIYLYLPAKQRLFSPYISAGVGMNYLPKSKTGITASYLYQPTSEELKVTCRYAAAYMQTQIEVGVCFHPQNQQYNKGSNNGPVVFLGLKYCLAGTMLKGDYQDSQNESILYKDHVQASGSYAALTLKIGNAFQIGSHKNVKFAGYHHHKSKKKSREKTPVKKFSPNSLGW
jgi:hypothetical protein